jgi:hypothetical protein
MSTAVRWWSHDASPVPQFAADELSRYFERIAPTSVSVQRVEPPTNDLQSGLTLGPEPTNGLQSGLTLGPEPLTIALHGSPDDSFALRITDGSASMAATTHRGTLYAAYELLQQLGVRFFAPRFPFYSDAVELVPAVASPELADADIVQRPAMPLRRKYVEEGWSHTPSTLVQLIDWMAKQRLNVLVYPYDYLGHGLVRWDTWCDQLLPELQRRGILLEVGGHGPMPENFDASNPDAVRAYTARVLTYLQARPEINIFDAWPADSPHWLQPSAQFNSEAEAQVRVVNHLASEAETSGVATRFEALAYSVTDTLEPPRNRYAPSVILDLAPYDRSHVLPISKQKYALLIDRWRTAQPRNDFGIHEYYRRYAWRSLPVLLPHLIAEDVAFYVESGVRGLGMYSEPADWLTFELNHLLTATLSFDPSVEVEAFVRTYVAERFGTAAGAMADYLRLVESAALVIFDRPFGDFLDDEKVRQVSSRYRQAAEALAAAPRPNVLLDRLAANLEYACADVDGDFDMARELLERYMFDGIVLPHPTALRRAQPGIKRENCAWVYAAYRALWP